MPTFKTGLEAAVPWQAQAASPLKQALARRRLEEWRQRKAAASPAPRFMASPVPMQAAVPGAPVEVAPPVVSVTTVEPVPQPLPAPAEMQGVPAPAAYGDELASRLARLRTLWLMRQQAAGFQRMPMQM